MKYCCLRVTRQNIAMSSSVAAISDLAFQVKLRSILNSLIRLAAVYKTWMLMHYIVMSDNLNRIYRYGKQMAASKTEVLIMLVKCVK